MIGNEKRAILLLGHGSRASDANEAMYRVAQDLKEQEVYSIIECAFLEMSSPDIATGLTTCKAQGAATILIIPYFLHLGMHVQRDLPQIIGQWHEANPEVAVKQGNHLGYSPLLTQLVQQRIDEAIS